MDTKGKQFLDLLDNNLQFLEPSYSKGELWLKYFSYLNSLCARALRAIVNYTLTGEYQLRFFPHKEFKCPCSHYPIEMRIISFMNVEGLTIIRILGKIQ